MKAKMSTTAPGQEPRGFRQAKIRLWRWDQNPAQDEPHEEFGIVQATLEDTLKFVEAGLKTHWRGECACQTRSRKTTAGGTTMTYTATPAKPSRPTAATCCFIPCEAPAEWEILGEKPGQHPADGYTLACTAHVGELLDDSPSFVVVPLAPAAATEGGEDA